MVLEHYAEPLKLFGDYFSRAREDVSHDPTAVALATATPDGHPSVRMVLLKAVDDRGLVFFTNHGSRKAQELLANPHAAMCFHWPRLEVQARVEGLVERIAQEDSDAYFASRPRESQIGAWASRQSEVLSSRQQLLDQVAQFTERFAGQDVPRPPHWGGFLLVPTRVEFWQGELARLHDRLVYEREGLGWRKFRLFP